MTAAVDYPADESCSCGVSKLGRPYGRYKTCRIEGEKLRDTGMSNICLVVVLSPFHYLSVLANLRLWELSKHSCQFCGKRLVSAECMRSLDSRAEEYSEYLRVHSRTHAYTCLNAVFVNIGVFRRDRGSCDKSAAAVLCEVFHKELGSFF